MPLEFNRRTLFGLSAGLLFSSLYSCSKKMIASNATIEPSSAAPRLQRLGIHDRGRHLVQEDGSPFFYLGDTAWELFHRLNREEARDYLSDRASKGFTVIQAVVLAELGGLTVPNPYGHLPLEDTDPARPVDAYFQHVDYIVDQAEALGLYIGMLPTWGDKWNKAWGNQPEVFTPSNAETFGRYVGNRYKDKPIIWILGGDRAPDNDDHLAIIHAMARGVKEGDGGNHLMTFHPWAGPSSATWFHNEEWLDFNMFQSGHKAKNLPNYQTTTENYQLTPPKPVLDGEPCYEDHPVNWRPNEGWFDDYDVRKAAYWPLLAGACGHTYGNHNIWQMYQRDRDPVSSARTPWREALAHPGSTQMGYVRQLFESRPFIELVPDQTLIVSEIGEGGDHRRAARAENGSFALIYMPKGAPILIDLTKIEGPQVSGYWYDPRQGNATAIDALSTDGTHEFTPPSLGEPNDWVLVLDSSAREFTAL